MASTDSASSSDCLLYVTDKATGMPFLVDSGAQVSLLPATTAGRCTIPCKFTLQAVNGLLIHTYREKCMELNLGLRKKYTHIFIVADVNSTLLGTDFL